MGGISLRKKERFTADSPVISFFVIFVYLYNEYETLSVSISSFDHRAILMCPSAGPQDAE